MANFAQKSKKDDDQDDAANLEGIHQHRFPKAGREKGQTYMDEQLQFQQRNNAQEEKSSREDVHVERRCRIGSTQ